MPADSAMLAAVRDAVVGLPEGQAGGAQGPKGTLAPPPQPRRATSDQNSSHYAHHAHSHSHSAPRPAETPLQQHARSTSTNALPSSSSSSRDPFSDKSKPSKSSSSGDKKKGSKHADAIDKLDPSNFWGGMLHHESAYDAAAPSRNIRTARGGAAPPMGAFKDASESAPAPTKQRGLSALANHTLEKMGSIKFSDDTKASPGPHSAPAAGGSHGADSYFDVLPTVPSNGSPREDELATTTTPRGTGRSSGGPIGRGLKLIRSRSRDRKTSGGDKGRIPGVGSMPDEDDYLNARAKQKKNALANAWGVADPEPFEDFSAMAAATGPRGDTGLASAASSIWNGHERHVPPPPVLQDRKGSVGPADRWGATRGGEKKYTLTETYAGDADGEGEEVLSTNDMTTGTYGSAPAGGGGGVKRSKSLMQRIRNMRENPNVPLAPEGKPSSPGSAGSPSSLPSSGSHHSTFAAAQQQRKGMFGRQMSSRSDHSGSSVPAPSPPSEGSFVLVPSLAADPAAAAPNTSSRAHHGRTRSRSELVPTSASSSSLSSQRDKSLPRLPTELATTTNPDGEEDPFADAPDEHPPSSPARRPSDQHLASSSGGGGRLIGRTRSPVPPPAPIDLPGQDQSHLYPMRFADRNDSYTGGGSTNGGAALGRKGSLMKRVLGRG